MAWYENPPTEVDGWQPPLRHQLVGQVTTNAQELRRLPNRKKERLGAISVGLAYIHDLIWPGARIVHLLCTDYICTTDSCQEITRCLSRPSRTRELDLVRSNLQRPSELPARARARRASAVFEINDGRGCYTGKFRQVTLSQRQVIAQLLESTHLFTE